jgi:hypothetical protein
VYTFVAALSAQEHWQAQLHWSWLFWRDWVAVILAPWLPTIGIVGAVWIYRGFRSN